jgi:hypothetical protein
MTFTFIWLNLVRYSYLQQIAISPPLQIAIYQYSWTRKKTAILILYLYFWHSLDNGKMPQVLNPSNFDLI